MSLTPIRITTPTLIVLRMLHHARARNEPLYGYVIWKTTGLGPGTVYPILRRLTNNGWVHAVYETRPATRPAKRLHTLTPAGSTEFERIIQQRRAHRRTR